MQSPFRIVTQLSTRRRQPDIRETQVGGQWNAQCSQGQFRSPIPVIRVPKPSGPEVPGAPAFLRWQFKLTSPIQAGEICFSTKSCHHLQNEGGEKSWEMPSRFPRDITRRQPI